MSTFTERMRRERNRRIRRARQREILRAIPYVLAIVGVQFAFVLTLIAIVQYFPFGIFSGLPQRFLSDLDESLIVSLLVADLPIGGFVALFAWRFLGERKLSNITQAEAMAKYSHLKIIAKQRKQYVLNKKTNVGYKIPAYISKLASEDVIEIGSEHEALTFRMTFDEPANHGIYIAQKEPTLGELGLEGS